MGDEERRDKGILMLGDDNFDAWERAVGDALYGAGAYELVEASKPRPAVYNEAMKVYAWTYRCRRGFRLVYTGKAVVCRSESHFLKRSRHTRRLRT